MSLTFSMLLFNLFLFHLLCSSLVFRHAIAMAKNSSISQKQRPSKRIEFSSLHVSDPLIIEHLSKNSGYCRLSTNGARMFYFFFEARNIASNKVIIWLNADGFSSNVGLFYENGPFHFAKDSSSLSWNEFGWDTVSNILYIDQPIGTGFSYDQHESQYIKRDAHDVLNDLYDFLQVFINSHQEYAGKDLYIAGEFYAAHVALSLAYRIWLESESDAKPNPPLTIKGIAIGNALIDLGTQYAEIPKFAEKNFLISYQDYMHIKEENFGRCGEYLGICKDSQVDQEDARHLEDEDARRREEDACGMAFVFCNHILQDTKKAMVADVNEFNIIKLREGPLMYDHMKLEALLNDEDVKTALYAPIDRRFVLFKPSVYEALKADFAINPLRQLTTLLNADIKFLSYNGEHDMVSNFDGIMEAFSKVPWKGQTRFKIAKAHGSSTPFIVDGKVVGKYVKIEALTVLKVFDAGRMVPMDQREASHEMMRRWINGFPL